MNNLLELKGNFESIAGEKHGGPASMPKDGVVKVAKIDVLIKELKSISEFWDKDDLILGALVDILYIRTIAKSNRVKQLLKYNRVDPNDKVVGARFEGEGKDDGER